MFVRMGEPGMVFCWYQKMIRNLPEWLWKPIGGCERCLTGQVLFHYYWITHLSNYNLIDQLFIPSFGIFLVIIYAYIYDKLCE